jgi:cobalt-zinc-cadmium efflux system outer membrane protein
MHLGLRFSAPAVACILAGACATIDESSLASVSLDATPETPKSGELDLTKPLTLDDVARAVAARNLDLRAERTALSVKDAEAARAGAWPDPNVSIAVVQPVANLSTPPETTGGSVGVDWDVGAIFVKGAEHAQALQEAEAARLAYRYRESVVAGDARLAAAKVASLTRRRTIAEGARQATQGLADAAAKARDAGDTTIDDVGARQVAALEAESRTQEIEAQLEEARNDLASALAYPPGTNVDVAGPAASFTAADPDALDRLVARARTTRADLVALERAYDSHEQALRAAVLGMFPRFGINLEGARDPGGFVSLGGGVTLSLPLFDGNRAAVAVELATREELRAEYLARLHQTRADIAKLIAAGKRAKEARRALAERLPKLQEAEAALATAAAAHNVTVVAYVEVQSALRDAQLRDLALAEEEIETRLALETAVGAAPSATSGGAP